MYAIDKIEENVVVAEDLETKEKITINRKYFPFPIHEGLIFSKKEDVIIQEEGVQKVRRKKLQEKMERLKRREQK